MITVKVEGHPDKAIKKNVQKLVLENAIKN